MNVLKSTLTVTLAGLLFMGCKDKTSQTVSETGESIPKVKKEISAANLQTASFSIKGMTCAIGCAKTIEKELNGLDGVQNVSVDFEKKSAVVSFDKSIIKPENITKVVEATGDGSTYKVTNLKL